METDHLLARYFGGTATEHELSQLEDWIAASPQNEDEFLRMTKLYELTGAPLKARQDLNTDAAKEKFSKYRTQGNVKKRLQFIATTNNRNWLMGIAAVGLLMLVTTFFWQKHRNDAVVLTAQLTPIATQLADKTKIRLSANSTITYNESFAKNDKKITLEGEARFEVGTAGNGKLHLTAGETFIEDIGTIFEVSAFDQNGYVQVKVTEGLVRFYTATDKGIEIKAHETGIYDKQTHKFHIAAGCNMEKGKELIQLNLDGVSLQQAVDIIENAYGISVELAEDDFAQKQITVSFSNEKAETVLSVLGQTLGLKTEKVGNHFLLKK